MLLHGVVIDQNVVYVYDHKVIKPFLENVTSEGAKCGGCIGKSKRYHQEFGGAIPCATSVLFFIPFCNSNLVIPKVQANPTKHFSFQKLIKQIINSR
jgi:hypothetical protein